MPFWSKKSTIISSELKLEWEHLFRTFLRWFRRKIDLWELHKRAKHKTEQKTWQGDDKLIIYSAWAFSMERKQSLFLNNFSALEASKWFQITYTNLTKSWIPFPKDLATILGKIKDFSMTSAITLVRILIFQINVTKKICVTSDSHQIWTVKWPHN